MNQFTFIALGWAGLLVVVGIAIRAGWRSERVRRRLFLEEGANLPIRDDDQITFVGRWLMVAGFRSSAAEGVFWAITLAGFCLGLVLALVLARSGVIGQTLRTMAAIPGNVMDIFTPVVDGMPYIIVAALTALPALVVRAARRERVRKIEEDLPITLELLSTLAESGLGFDAALERVAQSQPADRPLMVELRTFRAETLSGRPRVQSFRRLSRRMDITSFSTVVSALVQAEQVGSGISAVLRQQADDVRNRRRERAIEAAMSLPVKRLLPLMICFMPGVFVWALGPSLFQMLQLMGVFTRQGGIR